MRLKEDYPVVAEAVGELCRLSGDSDARYLADLREKGRRDQQAGIDYAMEKGLERGRAEGRQDILDLIKQGWTTEQLQRFLEQGNRPASS